MKVGRNAWTIAIWEFEIVVAVQVDLMIDSFGYLMLDSREPSNLLAQL
jgi:hypothetical protein